MFEQTFKNIDNILHKDAGCGSELDYVEQTSWLLFLKYLKRRLMRAHFRARENTVHQRKLSYFIDLTGMRKKCTVSSISRDLIRRSKVIDFYALKRT